MSESEFSTDQVFKSSKELVEWAQKVARSQGYVLVTKRSKKKNGYLSRIILMCDLGGVYKSRGCGIKITSTRKVDCKFELVGRYYKTTDLWVLSAKCLKHNHPPAMFMEGHAYAKRLSSHENGLVAMMTCQNLKARDILSTLKVLDKNNVSTNKTIYKQGLKNFLPYFTWTQDVDGDGNCGFRAVASCLGRHEDSWRGIRMDLLHELSEHHARYSLIFNEEGVQFLQNSLNHFEEGRAPRNRWMVMPDTGLLVASRYNVVVVFLSKEGETLCLPLFSSPSKSQSHHIWVIARFNGDHFVKLELQEDFPIPPTHPQWSHHASDRTWEHLYLHRQNAFNQLKFPNRNSEFRKSFFNV